jgi:pyruvate,water dikinase
VYFNSKIDYASLPAMLHPTLRRQELLEHIPPAWRDDLLKEPFSWKQFAMIWVRIALLDQRHLPWECWKHNYGLIEAESETAHGLPVEQIKRMSDRALLKYTKARIFAEPEYFQAYLGLFYLHLPIAMGILHYMVEHWLGDSDPSTVSLLLAGSPHESITVKENRRLQELAQDISASPQLRSLFEQHPSAAFFEEVQKHPETRAFHEKYRRFVADYGHRGHADRDIWFDRRAENARIDYTALSSMLDVDFAASQEKANAVATRRKKLTDEVIAKLKLMPFGDSRAQAFAFVQDWVLQFWAFRDDERAHADKITFSIKKAFQEVGRRLFERGVIERPDDYYFFSSHELFELFNTGKSTRLSRAKAVARRKNHEQFKRTFFAPKYMVGDRYEELEETEKSEDPNVLKGVGTSRGEVTGTARVIASQTDIGRVRKGEILVTAATDPGWTPVFMVISGLVLETGGMLAHGSLLSREYGIPAVQIPNAMKKIRDGMRITVNGDTGKVHFEGAQPALAPE